MCTETAEESAQNLAGFLHAFTLGLHCDIARRLDGLTRQAACGYRYRVRLCIARVGHIARMELSLLRRVGPTGAGVGPVAVEASPVTLEPNHSSVRLRTIGSNRCGGSRRSATCPASRMGTASGHRDDAGRRIPAV